MSGGIEIEIPGWEEVEVGVGFSAAAEPSSSIAPRAGAQVTNEAELQAALAAQEPEIELSVGFPITATHTIQAGYDVLISSDAAGPYTLSRESSFKGAFFLATDGGKITLKNIVLDGGGDAVAGVTGSLVEANDRGTVTLDSGATLRNNVKSDGNGGGLSAIADSTVYIKDGSVVEYNKTPGENYGIGGGVYVGRSWPENDASQLFLSGGTIRYNESKGGGGGLSLGSTSATALMTGGDIVYNKSTPDYLGGGLSTSGTFTMSGGTISNNIGTRGGGGVYVSDGEFTMTGGAVSENVATTGGGWGGGIWQGSFGYTQILGGEISDNQANYGGGIYHEYYEPHRDKTGIVISDNAIISGNTATKTGGGVCVLMPNKSLTNKRIFELSGNAKITGNSAKDVGGLALWAETPDHNADITLGGNAEISDNTSVAQAGGLYLYGIDAEITGTVTVSGNKAKYGGGVRVMPPSEAGLSTSLAIGDSVSIAGNEAELGGGVCLSHETTFAAQGDASVSGNIGDLGAGLFVLGSEATIGGSAVINANNASLVGGSTENHSAGAMYLSETNTGQTAVVNLSESATVSNNTAGKETGGIIIDGGATLNVSGSARIVGNAFAGVASGVAVYPDATLNVWGTSQIGASATDNGVFLASGMFATIPAGENLLAGARVNFEGLEDGAAVGSLVAKRADGSTAASDESALMAWTVGTYSVVRNASNASEYVLDDAPAPPVIKTLSIARLYGADRYETSGKVSSYERDLATASTVIIASGADRNFPDALAASALSGANGNAPILLTDPASLPDAARAALSQATAATKVYLIGDGYAVSGSVESEIRALLPAAQIERLGGEARQQTAELIFPELGTSASKTAILARSMNFPDSLSASPWAAASVSPIFLTGFDERSITQGTLDALAAGGFERLVVLGDGYSIPDSVAAAARDAAGLSEADVVRIGGEDRMETSLLFAQWATDPARGSEALSWDNLAITRADKHPDALSGGALQGMHGSVVLLTSPNEVHDGVASAIAAASDSISEIRFFGDEYSVSVPLMRAYAGAVPFDDHVWKPDDSVAFDL